jgi:molybdopterin-guanine dinucleotide biosynthesis protein A
VKKHAITPYVIAGGHSSRFGTTDKARAVVRGEPLVVGVARHMEGVFDQPATVVSAPGRDYGDLGLPTIFDEYPDCGPMSGVHRALMDTATDWIAVAACDLVGLTDELWPPLVQHRGSGLAIAYFRMGYWQPVLALYHVSLIGELVNRLDSHQLSMQPLLNDYGWPVPATPEFAEVVSVDSPDILAEVMEGGLR